MPTKGFDCIGFAAYVLGDDGRFHPADLSQTVTLSADMADGDDKTNYGLVLGAEDHYYYKAVGDYELKATMHCRFGSRLMMKITSTPREFRRWVRRREKERRKRLKEASGNV